GFLFLEPRTFQVVLLIGMAIAKTFLVAWYYMHLISERPAIILIACAPFIFSVFLTIGLFPWDPPPALEDLPDARSQLIEEAPAQESASSKMRSAQLDVRVLSPLPGKSS